MAKSRSKNSRQPVKKSPAKKSAPVRRGAKPRRAKAVVRKPAAAAVRKGQMGLCLRRRQGRRPRQRCATCSAARARAWPRWRISACRCRPASPSPPRSAPISTPARQNLSEGLEAQVEAALAAVGRITGKKFGDAENPLLVSVRSGARASMPGMMDTVLNLGLNDETVEALAEKSGDRRFAYDSYRRFINMYSDVVLGIGHHHFEEILDDHKDRNGYSLDTDLDADDWAELIVALQGARRGGKRQAVPAGPARAVVGRDRRGVRLVDEPARHHLSPPARHSGKLGHRRQRAGHGVRQYGRDLGDRRRLHAQPFDRREEALRRVSDQRPGRGRGRRHPHAAGDHRRSAHARRAPTSRRWRAALPDAFAELKRIHAVLERHYRDMQDLEFTVEQGKLWMLQTRSGKRTAKAALAHRGRAGQREADQQGRGGDARRSRRARSAPASDHRSERRAQGHRHRPAGVARRRLRRDRVLLRRGRDCSRARAARSSWCASRPRPRTFTACTPPRAF